MLLLQLIAKPSTLAIPNVDAMRVSKWFSHALVAACSDWQSNTKAEYHRKAHVRRIGDPKEEHSVRSISRLGNSIIMWSIVCKTPRTIRKLVLLRGQEQFAGFL